MSTIISQEEIGEIHPKYFVTVKGAAEVLKEMVMKTFLMSLISSLFCTLYFAVYIGSR